MGAQVHLTPQELADRLRLTNVKTLANWRCRRPRKGPPYINFGRKVLYPLDQVESWEREQTIKPG